MVTRYLSQTSPGVRRKTGCCPATLSCRGGASAEGGRAATTLHSRQRLGYPHGLPEEDSMAETRKAAGAIKKAVRGTVTQAAEAALARVAELAPPPTPGAPAPEPPSLAEP